MGRRNFFRQSQRRRYRSNAYRNPHLAHRKTLPWKPVCLGIMGLAVAAAGLSFLFGNQMFRISQVEVRGVQYLSREDLEQVVADSLTQRAWLFFDRTNRFLFSTEQLTRALTDAFALSSVTVGLREGRVFIQLEERTSNLLWQAQGRLYVVDLQGVVAREVSREESAQDPILKTLPLFIDINDIGVQPGSLVMTSQEVENAFLFLTRLADKGIAVRSTELDRLAGKWVKALTEEGYAIFYDLSGDIGLQADHLDVVLREQVSDPSSLEYIDLRFGDRVYIK